MHADCSSYLQELVRGVRCHHCDVVYQFLNAHPPFIRPSPVSSTTWPHISGISSQCDTVLGKVQETLFKSATTQRCVRPQLIVTSVSVFKIIHWIGNEIHWTGAVRIRNVTDSEKNPLDGPENPLDISSQSSQNNHTDRHSELKWWNWEAIVGWWKRSGSYGRHGNLELETFRANLEL